MDIELLLQEKIKEAIKVLYAADADISQIGLQKTRKEFEGDITLVCFTLLKISKKSPDATANDIGEYLKSNTKDVVAYNVVKGFLNISLSDSLWTSVLSTAFREENYGTQPIDTQSAPVLIEYSSPNTNKPLHLGHIRNNFLGFSLAEILKASGKKVIKVNLVNDRGIHICKSMIAWIRWGNGETPESSGLKGDHLAGKYYVLFDKKYKEEIEELKAAGQDEKSAAKNAPLLISAQELLQHWESGDKEVIDLWKKMNGWVYDGFNLTYKKMGVDFDRMYYESETYLLGKSNVMEGLEKNILIKENDNSIWIDLTPEGLDKKILLRSDGTSVYMTQDIGTAIQRHEEYKFEKLIYVVGNEQDYHFKVLKLVLKKLGYAWSDALYHFSYGMVDLPSGKMKSREGTVVDADDLIDEMINTAKETSQQLGKLEGLSAEELQKTYETIALGALKYYILKVDPVKRMLYDPKESIDLNGNTGPFIQYTYARIQSVLRKAKEQIIDVKQEIPNLDVYHAKEKELMKLVNEFPLIVMEAAKNLSPALIANYTFDLAKEYNQFYHDCTILKEENTNIRLYRLQLSEVVGNIIRRAMKLLGINVPEKM